MLIKSKFLKFASCCIVLGAILMIWYEARGVSAARDAMRAHWKQHREECLRTPIAEYTKDRSRALRGVVRSSSGEPVSGAVVRCLSLPVLMQFVSQPGFDPDAWKDFIETETYTDEDGRYTFPYLEIGTRTICVDADGYAPTTRNMVTVQDGMGPRIDLVLEPIESLKLTLDAPAPQDIMVCVVPFQWWPELMHGAKADANGVVTFPRVGGAFRKGIVMLSSSADDSGWKPAATFDVERNTEIIVSLQSEFAPSPGDLPEIGQIEYSDTVEDATRQFYALLTPMALMWKTTNPVDQPTEPDGDTRARLYGFASGPLLPVLLTRAEGGGYLTLSSGASEFDVTGIRSGTYRLRAYHRRGYLSYSRGAIVRAGSSTMLKTGLRERIDFEDDKDFEIQGVVTWPGGEPAVKAKVVVQDIQNFRRFLKKATTDENGFFRVPNVYPDRTYVMFALPADATNAVRNFSSKTVVAGNRESWVELSLHNNTLSGTSPQGGEKEPLELVQKYPDGKERSLWKFSTKQGGRFSLSNIRQGNYVIRSRGSINFRSRVVNVEDDQPPAKVVWED